MCGGQSFNALYFLCRKFAPQSMIARGSESIMQDLGPVAQSCWRRSCWDSHVTVPVSMFLH